MAQEVVGSSPISHPSRLSGTVRESTESPLPAMDSGFFVVSSVHALKFFILIWEILFIVSRDSEQCYQAYLVMDQWFMDWLARFGPWSKCPQIKLCKIILLRTTEPAWAKFNAPIRKDLGQTGKDHTLSDRSLWMVYSGVVQQFYRKFLMLFRYSLKNSFYYLLFSVAPVFHGGDGAVTTGLVLLHGNMI